MGLDPRITQAYYAQVVGAKATDSTNTAYKFPCDAVLPDILLNFATGGTVGLSGYSLSFNNPDADNSESTLLSSLAPRSLFALCSLTCLLRLIYANARIMQCVRAQSAPRASRRAAQATMR